MTARNSDDRLTLREIKESGKHRDITTRSFPVRADTIDEDARSVEAILATEAPTLVFDWARYEVVEEVLLMSGVTPPEQVPMLESHLRFQTDYILGSVRDIRTEGDKALCRLVFVKGDEDVERVWNKVKQKHITDVSVGYRVLESVDVAAGTEVKIGGRMFKAGKNTLRVTTKWEIREGSLVVVGADDVAKIRAEHTRLGVEKMTEQLRTYLESLGMTRGASDADAWAFYRGLQGAQLARADELKTGAAPVAPAPAERQRAAPVAPAPTPAAAEPVRTEPAPTAVVAPDADSIRKAERERITTIRGLAGSDGRVPNELIERAITDGLTPDQAGRSFLESFRGSLAQQAAPGTPGNPASAPAVRAIDPNEVCNVRSLRASILMRGDVRLVDPKAPLGERQAQEKAADDARRFGDWTLIDYCREALRLDGRSAPSSRVDIMRAAVSGGALSNIFTTSINASLLQSYTEAPDTTEGWVRTVDVGDFKTQERLRLTKLGALEKLARGGTAAHAIPGDTSESYKIGRYATQFAMDEQDIRDDRFDVLTTIPKEMGAAAARLRPDLCYYILLANGNLADGVALFEAAVHLNLTTAVLGAAGIQAAIAEMAKQKEGEANLNIRPRFLLVPQDLAFAARILLRSVDRDHDGADGTFNPLRDFNIQIREDNRMGVAGVTDPATGATQAGSATNWFLSAGANDAPTVEVGYLAGTGRSPVIRSYQLTEGRWGLGWDINLDIGAKALDFRGMHKSTGAG